MSVTNPYLDTDLVDYMRSISLRPDPVLDALREETARLPEGAMQISDHQGRLMTMLTRLTGARRALEVGVFTGYSSICVARGLPDDGELVACDKSEAFTAVARRYWRLAGVEDKIDLRLGPALESLDALLDESRAGTFDMAFLDADKPGNPQYVERCLRLLRPGGLMLIDNAFVGGRVLDEDPESESARVMRELNRSLAEDPRVEVVLLPVGDGLALVRTAEEG
jgi:predicted O-methyltransferase YrrM